VNYIVVILWRNKHKHAWTCPWPRSAASGGLLAAISLNRLKRLISVDFWTLINAFWDQLKQLWLLALINAGSRKPTMMWFSENLKMGWKIGKNFSTRRDPTEQPHGHASKVTNHAILVISPSDVISPSEVISKIWISNVRKFNHNFPWIDDF
jgi:hypothetical protein